MIVHASDPRLMSRCSRGECDKQSLENDDRAIYSAIGRCNEYLLYPVSATAEFYYRKEMTFARAGLASILICYPQPSGSDSLPG